MLEGKDWSSSVMFSDGENLGMITAGKDVINVIVYLNIVVLFDIFIHFFIFSQQEGFVVRTINTLSNPVTVASELPLKLARKCVDIFGYATFDEEQAIHILNPGYDDEIAMVTAGKEFGLLKTVSGKVRIM